jgi:hypothetical protein
MLTFTQKSFCWSVFFRVSLNICKQLYTLCATRPAHLVFFDEFNNLRNLTTFESVELFRNTDAQRMDKNVSNIPTHFATGSHFKCVGPLNTRLASEVVLIPVPGV